MKRKSTCADTAMVYDRGLHKELPGKTLEHEGQHKTPGRPLLHDEAFKAVERNLKKVAGLTVSTYPIWACWPRCGAITQRTRYARTLGRFVVLGEWTTDCTA
uniref:Uncharacterized protein n=1 Tax=Fervidicoccus fontis TaxID=683846 RepID=A0A7J3ZLW8_9CREN